MSDHCQMGARGSQRIGFGADVQSLIVPAVPQHRAERIAFPGHPGKNRSQLRFDKQTSLVLHPRVQQQNISFLVHTVYRVPYRGNHTFPGGQPTPSQAFKVRVRLQDEVDGDVEAQAFAAFACLAADSQEQFGKVLGACHTEVAIASGHYGKHDQQLHEDGSRVCLGVLAGSLSQFTQYSVVVQASSAGRGRSN